MNIARKCVKYKYEEKCFSYFLKIMNEHYNKGFNVEKLWIFDSKKGIF